MTSSNLWSSSLQTKFPEDFHRLSIFQEKNNQKSGKTPYFSVKNTHMPSTEDSDPDTSEAGQDMRPELRPDFGDAGRPVQRPEHDRHDHGLHMIFTVIGM